MSLGSILLFALAVVLGVSAALLARASSRAPWPAIVVAALTSAVCYTVGGESSMDSAGPSIATVTGSIAGLLSVVAAIMTLVPSRSRSEDGEASRTPILLSSGGIAIGAVGLLITSVIS